MDSVITAVGMVDELERGIPSAITEDLAADKINLTDSELRERMSGNLCRCGAYNGIVDAIQETFAGKAAPPGARAATRRARHDSV